MEKKKKLDKISITCVLLGIVLLSASNGNNLTAQSGSGSGCPSGTTPSSGYTFSRHGILVTHCPPDQGIVANTVCCRSK